MENLKIFAKTIDEKAKAQIDLLLKQKAFSQCKVRIMPDVHAGAGCVIGFTADLGDKVIPNIVGVDIGCGMYCYSIGKIDIDYKKLDNVIRKYVPAGMNVHSVFSGSFDFTKLHCYDKLKNKEWLEASLGTLGGGNHFIEIDKDAEGKEYGKCYCFSCPLGIEAEQEDLSEKTIDWDGLCECGEVTEGEYLLVDVGNEATDDQKNALYSYERYIHRYDKKWLDAHNIPNSLVEQEKHYENRKSKKRKKVK